MIHSHTLKHTRINQFTRHKVAFNWCDRHWSVCICVCVYVSPIVLCYERTNKRVSMCECVLEPKNVSSHTCVYSPKRIVPHRQYERYNTNVLLCECVCCARVSPRLSERTQQAKSLKPGHNINQFPTNCTPVQTYKHKSMCSRTRCLKKFNIWLFFTRLCVNWSITRIYDGF